MTVQRKWVSGVGRLLVVGMTLLALAGCSTPFPQPQAGLQFADGIAAQELLERSVAAHGGDLREFTGEIVQSSDGRWYRLIQRIQPIVADAQYRFTAVESYRPAEQRYRIDYAGPAGEKTVVRTPGHTAVAYDGVGVDDPVRLRATAMTTDAFELFHFGPTFIKHRAHSLHRLADASEGGVRYRRLLVEIRPGFGEAESDQVVLWMHPQSDLLYRVHITLNGFETTRGAHVDTTFLDYETIGGMVLPSRFHERVRGPIRIDAHSWWITQRTVLAADP